MATNNKKKQNKDKNELNNYHVQLLSKRASRALDAREAAFKEAHAESPDLELVAYVRDKAAELGHSPREGEIEGWRYLKERFGNWNNLLRRAGLRPCKTVEPSGKYTLFKEEFDRQVVLYKEHKKYLKQRSKERQIEQAEKKKAQEAYLAEHPEAKKKKKHKKQTQTSVSKSDVPPESDPPGGEGDGK